MTDEIDNYSNDERAARPKFLVVLCILSFITLGFGILSALGSVLSGPQTDEQMLDAQVQIAESVSLMRDQGNESFAVFFEQVQDMMEDTNDHHQLATWLNILVLAIGLFGVIRMWKGFRQGFYLYIAYSILGSVVMYFYVSPSHIPMIFPVFSGVLSALFIFLYSRNLHWMR